MADAALSFDYDFAKDGKYIIAVNIRKTDGMAYQGGRIFFVIQSASSDLAYRWPRVGFHSWLRLRHLAPPPAAAYSTGSTAAISMPKPDRPT